jgi:hypothetical protein
MPGAIHHRDARKRNAPGELVGISRRDDVVGFARDNLRSARRCGGYVFVRLLSGW